MTTQTEGARTTVSTGAGEIDKKLGGGIPLGSLTLIEGQSDAGKSVLAQHFAFGSLTAGMHIAYYTAENTVRSLITQMQSLGMDSTDYFLADRFRIYPLPVSSESSMGDGLVALLLAHMATLPELFNCVIVDSITHVISHTAEEKILDLFSKAKAMSDRGQTLFLVAHSSAFSENTLIRVRSLCDAHLHLRMEALGERLVKVLEVPKVRNAERSTGNLIFFDVDPGVGMRIIPISKAKA